MDAKRRQSSVSQGRAAPDADEPAFDRHLQLGDLHRAADSVAEALINYQAALEALGDPSADPRAVDLRLRIADCHLVQGELRAAKGALSAAAAVPVRHDQRRRAYLSGYSGILAGTIGEYEPALARIRRAMDMLASSTEREDVAFRARLLLHLGAADERLGRTSTAGSSFEEALRLYQTIGDRRGIAHALNNLGLNRKQENRLREAIVFLHRALEVLDEVGDYGRKAPTCLNLGLIYTRLGEWPQARAQLTRALQIAREVDNRGRVTRALLALASLALRSREYGIAREYLDEAEGLANEHGYRRERVLAREFRGELVLLEGHASQALALLDEAMGEARDVAPGGDLCSEIARRQADAYLALGDLTRAEKSAAEAARLADKLGDRTEAATARRVIGLCQIRRGREEAGRATLEGALGIFADLGIRFETARTHLAAARVRLDTTSDDQREPEIDQHLEAARPLFEALGVPGYLAEVLHLAVEDRIRTNELEEAESVLRNAGRYVEASEEHTLVEQQMLLKARMDDAVHAGLAESDAVSPSRELHRLFREGVDLESATAALVEMVQRRTNSDRVALARGLDPASLTIVAARGGSERELARDLKRLEPMVHASMHRGLPSIRREPEGIDACAYALAPLCLPNDIWGVLYIDRKRNSIVGAYRPSDLKLIALLAELASISVLALERKRALNEPTAGTNFMSRVIYRSNAMGEILDIVRKVAKSPASVLLQGETGTGKGLIARAIHELGPRRTRPFVQINCAALPEALLESELFGHVTGAFTGAVRAKRGLFEEAEGGTIFLDEVDKTAKTVQGKLLHVLDHQEIRPVGANRWKRVDARVVSATNAGLRALIRSGEFLEDLYYRLNDIAIRIPPLRARTDDIELLARHFAERFRRESGRRAASFSPELVHWLLAHSWPGNVRELEKVVRGLVTMSEDDTAMDVEHLPAELRGVTPFLPNANGRTLRQAIQALERQLIESALVEERGNKSAVARRLKVSYPTLLAKVRTYDLEPGD